MDQFSCDWLEVCSNNSITDPHYWSMQTSHEWGFTLSSDSTFILIGDGARLSDFHRRGWRSVGEQETRAASLNHLAASDVLQLESEKRLYRFPVGTWRGSSKPELTFQRPFVFQVGSFHLGKCSIILGGGRQQLASETARFCSQFVRCQSRHCLDVSPDQGEWIRPMCLLCHLLSEKST